MSALYSVSFEFLLLPCCSHISCDATIPCAGVWFGFICGHRVFFVPELASYNHSNLEMNPRHYRTYQSSKKVLSNQLYGSKSRTHRYPPDRHSDNHKATVAFPQLHISKPNYHRIKRLCKHEHVWIQVECY